MIVSMKIKILSMIYKQTVVVGSWKNVGGKYVGGSYARTRQWTEDSADVVWSNGEILEFR